MNNNNSIHNTSQHIHLSVVIITYNEEKNIERCLEAAQTVADDIVVVDSFSTDKTVDICQKKGVRCVLHPFEGYTQQKNYAITQARYPHILSLDADEVLSETLQQSILMVKNNWQCDGYYVSRLNNFCGQWIRHCGWYPDRKLRLWDSRKGRWEGDNIHEHFELQANCTSDHLEGELLHYSFTSIEQHIRQINKFTDISAEVLYRKGKRPTFYHFYLKPFFKFWWMYVFKLGFLDGFYGWVICINSAHADFLKYVKLRRKYSDS